jgi:hypothetical protein
MVGSRRSQPPADLASVEAVFDNYRQPASRRRPRVDHSKIQLDSILFRALGLRR